MIRCFALVIVILLSHITIKASAINDLIEYCQLPNSIYGINIDYCQVEKNILTFVCHIDKESETYRSYLKMISDNDSESIKRNIEEAYEQYGGSINTQNINLYGTPYDDTWILYMLFKSKMITNIGQFVYYRKIGSELREKKVRLQFNIKETDLLKGTPNKIIHRMSIDMSDFDEVAIIIKYGGNVGEVIKEKYQMLRGIRLNQKALPTQAGLGITLDSIRIKDNTITYCGVVSDFVANAISMEDMKEIIQQMQLNMDVAIDKEKLKKAKGFPLLNMKMEYEWYKKSNKEKIASITFAYPSLEILNAWPDSIKSKEPTIDYTLEEDETRNIPICVYDPVDLGGSVTWSSMNLGANKVEECGGLFGCGDITGNLQSRNSVDYYIPDTIKSIKGNPLYDIVRCIKGEGWHMPSVEEWKELLNSATVVQATYKGVAGYKIIGSNGRAIFLPKNGFRDGDKEFDKSYCGFYWSSDVNDLTNCNDFLYMHEEFIMIDECRRWRGMSIRPVREY